MSAKGEPLEFEPLPMRRRTLVAVDANHYCLWTTSGESREIKADTAYEAVKASGLTDIIRIERMFNAGQNILDKSMFAIEGQLQAAVPHRDVADESAHDRIRRRRNPIISADELDDLMQELRRQAQDIMQGVLPTDAQGTTHETPVIETMQSESLVPSYAPPPVPTGQNIEVTSPVGLDVHNDGFDEIIPSALSAKPLQPKAVEFLKADMAEPSGNDLPPERELTPEEVENLLGGK